MKEDLQHLKQFVKDHPDNKMGWYLLGRHYEEAGKTKKSLYCYAKAGEVFEAYEKKKLPEAVEKEAEELAAAAPAAGAGPEAADARAAVREGSHEASEAAAPIGRRASRALWLRLAAVLALLAAGIVYSPGGIQAPGPEAAQTPPSATAGAVSPSPTPVLQAAGNAAKLAGVSFVGAGDTEEAKKRAAGSLLLHPPREGEAVVLAEAPRSSDGKWVLWTTRPRPLASVYGTGNGAAEVRYYDKAVCQCTPNDGGETAGSQAEAWLSREVEKAVLRSAAIAYRKEQGKLPAAAAELAGAYPNNRIPGLTALMKELWPLLQARDGTGGDPSAAPGDPKSPTPKPGRSPSTAAGTPSAEAGAVRMPTPLEQPLEIIVDTRNHRLAVVSGRVMLRNYPVGLGGKRTPKGGFQVSEKVKNPNGRSDGAFGSRGMTLSETEYAIHGTDEPDSIGKDESLGCIRMGKDDLEELYDLTPIGTRVTIAEGKLPDEIYRAKSRFRLPAEAKETNPAKVYRWLD